VVTPGLPASAARSPRRIALLIESDGPGGAETVVLRLAEGLLQRGHTVLPVTLANGQGWLPERLERLGLRVHLPPLRRAIDPGFAWALAGWARAHHVQVMHAHEFTMGFYCGLSGLRSGIPHIITMHGGVTFANAARRRQALRWSAHRAKALVGVSESTCVHLTRVLGIPRERMHLVLNGVPVHHGERSRTRASLGVADNTRLMLAVGNLYPVKGHAVLVDACALLQRMEGLPPWRVMIAGRGEEETRLRAQIATHNLGERVTLLGLRDDIPDLLAASDVWVLPSRSEGLPMAMLEAMLAEKPIVATAVGGIPDVLRGESCGLLARPEDPASLAEAMARVLRDPVLAARIARTAKQVALAEYTADVMVSRYEALYETAI
jgi:glycosyltransferase involved in cell wall biosynthesis